MTALIYLRVWWIALVTRIDRAIHPEEYQDRGARSDKRKDDPSWFV